MAHLEVNDLGLAVEWATLELPPRDHLLMDHPTAQLLHRASQDVLVHLGAAQRLLFHVLLGHLGFKKTDTHACSKPNNEQSAGPKLADPGKAGYSPVLLKIMERGEGLRVRRKQWQAQDGAEDGQSHPGTWNLSVVQGYSQ